MKSINFTTFKNKFDILVNKVVENRAPLKVTKNKNEAFVVMSIEDYKSYEETCYLTKTTANRKRLFSSIKRNKKGNLI